MIKARKHIVLTGFLSALAAIAPACSGQTGVAETVYVAPAAVNHYTPPGEFIINGNYAAPTRQRVTIDRHLAVMKYQVTEREYAQCVTAGACAPTALNQGRNMPVTGVNYLDAQSYAQWVTKVSGKAWRLPSDMEWVHFSGQGSKQAQMSSDNGKDWVDQWINRYEQDANNQRDAVRNLYPTGYFGENEFGIADIGGNVWEWTQSCFERITLDPSQNELSNNRFCGIMILQGRHRAYMPEFIRDASSGGCGAGIPPDYMGFRLVRDLQWHEILWQKVKGIPLS